MRRSQLLTLLTLLTAIMMVLVACGGAPAPQAVATAVPARTSAPAPSAPQQPTASP